MKPRIRYVKKLGKWELAWTHYRTNERKVFQHYVLDDVLWVLYYLYKLGFVANDNIQQQ